MNTKKVKEYFSDFRKKYNTTYGPVAEFLLRENADGFGPSFNDLLEALGEGEELDALADTDPADYSEAQHAQLREVFETLQEADVPGWCRSLQLRRIQLPDDIKDEALMIVRERRNSK